MSYLETLRCSKTLFPQVSNYAAKTIINGDSFEVRYKSSSIYHENYEHYIPIRGIKRKEHSDHMWYLLSSISGVAIFFENASFKQRAPTCEP